MGESKFKQKVIKAVRMIPYGQVASYGQIALMVGIPRAAIQVGWILHIAGDDGKTPWWRVINNAGRISTKCPEHTPLLQKELLEEEGVEVTGKLNIDIEKYRFRPAPDILRGLELDERYIEQVIAKYLI